MNEKNEKNELKIEGNATELTGAVADIKNGLTKLWGLAKNKLPEEKTHEQRVHDQAVSKVSRVNRNKAVADIAFSTTQVVIAGPASAIGAAGKGILKALAGMNKEANALIREANADAPAPKAGSSSNEERTSDD